MTAHAEAEWSRLLGGSRGRQPREPAVTGSSTGSPAFKLDTRRWSQADRIAGGSTIVLFISLFLSWFSAKYFLVTVSEDGLSAHGFLYIVLILCLAILGYLVVYAGFQEMPFKLPVGHENAMLIATVVNLVLVFIAFIDKPGGIGSGIGWSFGAFVALAAAAVAAAPLGLPAIQAARGKSTK